MAGELAAVGQQDAALDLLVAAARLAVVSGGGTREAARWPAAVSVLAEVCADPGDPRAVAVAALIDPAAPGPDRFWDMELDLTRDPDVLGPGALAALARADVARAGMLLDVAISEVRRAGRVGRLAQLSVLRARAAILVGDWHTVVGAAEQAGAAASASSQPLWLAHAIAAAAVAHAARGDSEAAWRLASQAEIAAGSAVRGTVQLARAVALLSEECHSEAGDVLVSVLRRPEPDVAHWETAAVLGYLAEATAGDRRHMQVVAETLAGGKWPATAAVRADLLYAHALLAEEDAAQEAFETARQAAVGVSPWLTARTELAYGRWLHRQHRGSEARPILRAAAHAFDSLGTRTWAMSTRRDLRACGWVPEPAAAPPPSETALTPREAQIVSLVAAGLSNREIGRRMYLSHRTVASHLYRIFPKLQITSRTQLAALAPELVPHEGATMAAAETSL